MPRLDFQITGAEAATRGLTPLLHFRLRITGASTAEPVQGILLTAQIQLQCPQRNYAAAEKERLVELFGPAEVWGKTLRNRLWTHSSTTIGPFSGSAEAVLPVPCSYDLNLASAKYFYALEGGEVSLLFLFSGSVFYSDGAGRLQLQPISWSKECVYPLPVRVWQELMEQYYPNGAWVSLRRDAFDRLYDFKRQRGLATWEETVEALLSAAERQSVLASAPNPEPTILPEVPA